jgi:hypothetical protein
MLLLWMGIAKIVLKELMETKKGCRMKTLAKSVVPVNFKAPLQKLQSPIALLAQRVNLVQPLVLLAKEIVKIVQLANLLQTRH